MGNPSPNDQLPQLDLTGSFTDAFRKPLAGYDPIVPDHGEGKLVFTEADVETSATVWDRLIRLVFVKRRVTLQIYSALHYQYKVHAMGVDPSLVRDDRNNLLRALRRGGITAKVLERALCALGLTLDDIILDVSDRDGKSHQFHANRARQE